MPVKLEGPLSRIRGPGEVVTGYVYDEEAGTLVPVWGPPALPAGKEVRMISAANPGKKVSKQSTKFPVADKVISNWKTGDGPIFRVKAKIPEPDGRLLITYGHGFQHCMEMLADEVKAGATLPWAVEVSYKGKTHKLWHAKRQSEATYPVCCQDLADRWAAKDKADGIYDSPERLT